MGLEPAAHTEEAWTERYLRQLIIQTVHILELDIVLSQIQCPHCNENPIYIFLFWELRGLSPNFHIHLSVSNLYIPRIGPHISCSRIDRSIVGMYKSLTDTWMWKLRLWPRNSFYGNLCFELSVLGLCSVHCTVILYISFLIHTHTLVQYSSY
jgi:hypothetical protein